MPLKDGSGNVYKIYKGRGKPINVYKNYEKIAGYEESTLEGQNILFKNTYDDVFSNIQIRGGFTQVGATPDIQGAEVLAVYPTFASNITLEVGNGTEKETVLIPKKIFLDDGNEVDLELKAVKTEEGDIGAYDYIEVEEGKVTLNKVIKSYDFTGKSANSNIFIKDKLNSVACYFLASSTTTSKIVNGIGLCSHFEKMKYDGTKLYYNSQGIYWGFSIGARIVFSVSYEILGITGEEDGATIATAFTEWVKGQGDAGTPLTIWYASSVAEVTDITNSDVGRALLNLRTHYKNTNISVAAEGAVPSVSVTVKVNEEEEYEH